MKGLGKKEVMKALRRMGELATERSIVIELCIYGGCAMMLAFDRRAITRDIDAVFHPTAEAKTLIQMIAREQNLPDDWLNDEVRQFLAPHGSVRVLPLDLPGFRIMAPTASYLLAMKALASRRALPGYKGDETDLRYLIGKMKIRTVSEVQDHIDQYYPDDVLSEQARGILKRIIGEVTEP